MKKKRQQMSSQANLKRGARSSLINFALLIIASLLFAASFPNIIFTNGLPLLAWIAFAPVFVLVNRVSIGASVFWGAFYGYAAFALFNYWLSVFHPLAGIIVGFVYLIYMAMLFPLLRIATIIFPRRGYILQFLLWMAYEYLRTLGFLGYSYGISGYSQWNLLPVIQIASITGVWGVSALVVFPSAWLAAMFSVNKNLKAFFRQEWVSASLWFVLLTASLIYGFAGRIDYSDAPTKRLALIQHNTDPWAPSHAPTVALALEEYWNDFRTLRRLSEEALAAYPDTDLVVWSETAFVPRIYWHSTVRDNPPFWALVRELLEFLREHDVPFIIGNDDTRRDPVRNPVWDHRVHYNAAILLERGEIVQIYRKIHLVPFTEHFPFQRQFPRIYQALVEADTHFWDTGTEFTVFESRGVRFATPICFEDSFGYLSREFVRHGAELLINIANHAWSGSLSAQMQSLTMAVFRSVENRRSMARSTSSGQTSVIDPNGKILAMAEPFAETWLVADVPIVNHTTFYTRHGDYLGVIFVWSAMILLISGSFLYIMRSTRRRGRTK